MATPDLKAELAFARTFLNTIGRQPISYSDDYQQPLENSLRRVPVLQIPVPPVPETKRVDTGAESSSTPLVTLTFKSLKPALTYTIPVSLTDSILSIKENLHSLHPDTLPPAEGQRILLKGKALADQKLLKEYNVKDGDTVNLIFKAVPPKESPATPSTTTPEIISPQPMAATPPANPFASASGSLDPSVKPAGGKKHQRIPSVVLSPSPSNESSALRDEVPKEIVLDIDANTASPISPVLRDEMVLAGPYHETVSNPEFWERLYAFLKSEFADPADAHLAFEDFLRASKGSLRASEIAKIRDHVGVIGMAGT